MRTFESPLPVAGRRCRAVHGIGVDGASGGTRDGDYADGQPARRAEPGGAGRSGSRCGSAAGCVRTIPFFTGRRRRMSSGCCAALSATSRWRLRCSSTTLLQDRSSDYFEHLLEQTSGQKLDWFFNDWVNRDRGLPDLSIEAVTPEPGKRGGQLYCRCDSG